MNQAIKEELIKRLKSGKYNHQTGHLKKIKIEGGKIITYHCATGVLVEMYLELSTTNGVSWIPANLGTPEAGQLINVEGKYSAPCSRTIPKEVREWAEINDEEFRSIYMANDMYNQVRYGDRVGYNNAIKAIAEIKTLIKDN